MFPSAFTQCQVLVDVETNNADNLPSMEYSGNQLPAKRTVRARSEGYASLDATSHGPEHFYDYFDKNVFEPYLSAQAPTPIEFPPVNLKIEQVEENYSQYHTEKNYEQIPERDIIKSENIPNRKRKRMACETSTYRAAKHMRGSENDEVIVIGDDDEDDVQFISSSAQNPIEQATTAGLSDAQIREEYRRKAAEIFECKTKLKQLEEAENAILENKFQEMNIFCTNYTRHSNL